MEKRTGRKMLVITIMILCDLAVLLIGQSTRQKPPEITLHLQNISVSGVTFFMENKQSAPVFYGASYGLSRKEADGWVEVPTLSGGPVLVNSLLYTLEGNTNSERTDVVWDNDYGQLLPGTYRFSKWVSTDESGEDRYTVSMEFEVPDDT